MAEIFISHASADTVLATRVAEGIRQAGHSIFLDSDREDGIASGAAWQRTLLRGLRICDAVVFLNSWAGQASMWCHSELVIATDLRKRVYSLDLVPDLQPHPLLLSLQGIRFEEFLSVLGGGLDPGSPVTVVMTVRSDRFDEIQRLPVIGPAISTPCVIVPIDPIGRDQCGQGCGMT